jgi:hypothetical protein
MVLTSPSIPSISTRTQEPLTLVSREVVHHYDLPGPERESEDPLDESLKHRLCGGAFHRHRRSHTLYR